MLMPSKWLVIAGVAVVLGYGAISALGGYKYRDSMCRADAAETQAAVSDALALLAARYTQADAELTAMRSERERQLNDKVRENVNATKRLPDRSPGWTAGERRLLAKTYCESFPDAAGCLPDQVRQSGHAAERE